MVLAVVTMDIIITHKTDIERLTNIMLSQLVSITPTVNTAQYSEIINLLKS